MSMQVGMYQAFRGNERKSTNTEGRSHNIKFDTSGNDSWHAGKALAADATADNRRRFQRTPRHIDVKSLAGINEPKEGGTNDYIRVEDMVRRSAEDDIHKQLKSTNFAQQDQLNIT